MRYMVERNSVQVVGGIWMPYGAKAAYEYPLSPYDVENIGKLTRENVERWLNKNAGDFSSIDDFCATVGTQEIPWATEEGELAYLDAMYKDNEN